MHDQLGNRTVDENLSMGRRELFANEDFFIPNLCSPQSVFFLVLFAQLLALVLALAGSSLSDFDWPRAGLISLMCQWVALTSAGIICAMRSHLIALPVALGGAVAYLIVIFVTAVFSFFGFFVVSKYNLSGEVSGLQTPTDILSPLLVAAVVAGMVFRYFWLQARLRAKQQAYLIAQLNALQARIHPHFLFNTLNTIASLISSDAEAAELAVIDLSLLMRVNLQQIKVLGSVEDEVKLCEGYLRIEQLRMGDRLIVNWSVANDTLVCVMPPLLLQPLLENAIYHGVQQTKSREPRPIDIRLWREGRYLRVRVENGLGEHSSAKGHKIALQNISDRLSALFGDASRIEIDDSDGDFVVNISYPASHYDKSAEKQATGPAL